MSMKPFSQPLETAAGQEIFVEIRDTAGNIEPNLAVPEDSRFLLIGFTESNEFHAPR